MNRQQQVLLRLKPKAKQLGFNTKELKGIAAKIADKLTSAEDASEEDVNAEIDEQIEAAIPYLTFAQSQANRLLDEWKKNHPETDDDDEPGDDDEPDDRRQSGSKKSPKNKGKDDVPEWAKALQKSFETMVGEITTLKGEKIADTRRSKLEALLKDTGTFGTRTLKSFAKMKFENDEEFDEFYSEVEDDLKAYNQERANEGLSALGVPPGTVKGKQEREENEVLSDDDVRELANFPNF